MAIFTVGPNSTFPSIAAAMAAAGPGDTIQLEAGYSNETATVTHSGMIITGEASSTGILLQLGSGIATTTLAGQAPIDLVDAADGNGIVGNDGDNLIIVTAGADAVSGGPGNDRLFVDYRLATGAVTGDSTSNVAEAGGGGRLVTINGGFEDFTIWTGSGADTITTGDGDDDIRTGEGAGTVTAGEGANHIVGGSGADTITAGSGGNFVDGGDGANTITTGGGADEILTGTGADTIVAGAGADRVTVTGGADTADAGAGADLLIVDYSAAVTDVSGGVTGGNLGAGYSGHLADLGVATLDFTGVEQFRVTTGSGNDSFWSGDGDDVISTGAGNDLLRGGGGADLLTGGTGDDDYHVDMAGDLVVEAAGEGRDVVYAGASYALAAGASIEVLSTNALGGTAAIDLTGNELDNVLYGNAGANVLNGGGGVDYMAGLGGDDDYHVDNAADYVVENAGGGRDVVYASVDYALAAGSSVEILSTDSLAGTAAIDFTGNELGNTLYGNAGANVLNGGGGADDLAGLLGDDTYHVDDQGDVVFEEAEGGRDVVYAGVDYALAAGSSVEVLSTIGLGESDAIDLTGNELGNILYGNAGANVLNGGGGSDYLVGFGGADSFAFAAALGSGNVDAVADFSAADDTIVLDDAVFAGLALGALDAGAFVTGPAALDADDRIVYDNATGALYFDADGSGAGAMVQFAILLDPVPLTASDFIVI
jgi:Ca2+-binding RTX toxin-like protein